MYKVAEILRRSDSPRQAVVYDLQMVDYPEGLSLQEHIAREISSIGIRIDVNGISRHGFSLNVDPEKEHWNGIVACGLAGYEQISMADLMTATPSISDVKSSIIKEFAIQFGYTIADRVETIFSKEIDTMDASRIKNGGR